MTLTEEARVMNCKNYLVTVIFPLIHLLLIVNEIHQFFAFKLKWSIMGTMRTS